MERYQAAMIQLALKLAEFIGLALGLPEGFFEKPGMLDNPMTVLRLLHYTGGLGLHHGTVVDRFDSCLYFTAAVSGSLS